MIGDRLKLVMEEKIISQTQLAEEVGVGQATISNYLSGKVTPKKGTLKAIADYLAVHETWLRTGEGAKNLHDEIPDSDKHRFINRKIKEIKTLASNELQYVLEDQELDTLEIYVKSIYKECEQVLDYIQLKN